MAPDPGPLWNHRGGQQRLGYSSLEFLTDLAAAFGPKRVFSSVEWVMKLLSKKKKTLLCGHAFHEECIARWFAVRVSCPVCRASPLSG